MSAFLRLVAWLLALALVALPVVAVIRGWIGAERWPLRSVIVTGKLERIADREIIAAVYPHAQRGFFAVRLQDAQAAVARLPWVEHAEVRKQWPDRLLVTVVEHRPFARWGADRLLSERGRIIAARGALPEGLPQFDGPPARSAEMMRLYNEARALFAASGVDVRTLRIDARGSWSMTLSDGAELLLGRDDAWLRLQRFARLMPQLGRDGRVLARADLRYTNGFALVWRAPAAPPAAAPAVTPSVVPTVAPRAAAVANALPTLPRIPAFPS
jgi:cell division protein FtsQ